MTFRWQEAFADIWNSLRHYELWPFMAWLEVAQQYRRSLIGPFWITLTTGIHVLALSLVFGILLKLRSSEIIPWITLGVILWGFFTGFINECGQLFDLKKDVIRETRRPYVFFVLVKFTKHGITFLHNLVIFLIVSLVYSIAINPKVLLVIPGAGLVTLTLVPIGLVVAVLSLRFRDLPPLINSLLMVGFFVTPIIWQPEQLGEYQLIAELNPFAHLIALVREPLLGRAPQASNWVAGLLISGWAWGCCIALLACFRRRIAFWL